jgi:hypothetical protein
MEMPTPRGHGVQSCPSYHQYCMSYTSPCLLKLSTSKPNTASLYRRFSVQTRTSTNLGGLRGNVVKALDGTEWRSIDIVYQALRAGPNGGTATVPITAKDARQPIWSSAVLSRLHQFLGNLLPVGLLQGDIRYSGNKGDTESETVQDPRISMDALPGI